MTDGLHLYLGNGDTPVNWIDPMHGYGFSFHAETRQDRATPSRSAKASNSS